MQLPFPYLCEWGQFSPCITIVIGIIQTMQIGAHPMTFMSCWNHYWSQPRRWPVIFTPIWLYSLTLWFLCHFCTTFFVTILASERYFRELSLLLRKHVKLVSHCPYGFYGQARTVNAYGQPKICPRYGLVRSARTVFTVTHGRPERYKYSCQIKSCNSLLRALRESSLQAEKHGLQSYGF